MIAASFAKLGLGLTTDQKAIRRAYATALKRIDQAADPEGFATLRGAYEHARAWADHQSEDNAEPTDGATWPPADAQPPAPNVQVPPDIIQPPRPSAPESSSFDAPSDGNQEKAELESDRGQAPQDRGGNAPEADRREDPPLRSREDLDEGVAYWTHRLMHTPDEEIAEALVGALADERLGHLEARDALARSLAQALREQPDRRLALFNNARRMFDWGGVDAPIPHNPALSSWVLMLLDQMERYNHLPLGLRTRMDGVLMSARRSAPSLAQAMLHAHSFELLLQQAPDLSVLDLGTERIQAWQRATKRFLQARNWVAGLAITPTKIAVTVVCVLGLAFMFQDARDGTTYSNARPARSSLVEGHVSLHTQSMRADPSPCSRSGPFGPPLGCPPLGLDKTKSETWPTATPQTPVITAQPKLPYPQDARVRAVKGMVWVRVQLDAQGKVQRKAVMISAANNALDQAAVDAASSVRMAPAMQDGIPVPGQAVLVFSYQLGTR